MSKLETPMILQYWVGVGGTLGCEARLGPLTAASARIGVVVVRLELGWPQGPAGHVGVAEVDEGDDVFPGNVHAADVDGDTGRPGVAAARGRGVRPASGVPAAAGRVHRAAA